MIADFCQAPIRLSTPSRQPSFERIRTAMCDPPLISIVIPTQNRPKQLRLALESILDQTYPHWEALVVDDGSEPPVSLDGLPQKISLLRLPCSKGVAHARNLGLAKARGSLLAFLDDDDTYLPEKLEKQVAYLREHPDIDLVFSKVWITGRSGHSRHHVRDAHVHDTLKNFSFFNIIHTNSVLFRRGLIDAVGFDERLEKYTDMQFFLALSLQFKIAFLPITVAVWNHGYHANQLSTLNYRRNYRNFRIICEIFADYIRRDRGLKMRYYGRLAYQALRCLDLGGGIKALLKIIF